MARRSELATIVVVVLLLSAGAVGGITGPTHFASSGVTYQTNSGLDVTLADDRDVEAVPFADDQTFASDNATLSAPGTATATVSDQTFGGETMAVTGIDATSNPVTLTRADLGSDLTLAGSQSGAILHDVTLDDNETDIELTADSETTLQIDNVPADIGLAAVSSTGETLGATTDTGDGEATLSVPSGQHEIRLQESPSTLEIRGLESQELITEGANGSELNVEIQFFGDSDTATTRNTTDGTVDMTGLPADERFAITVDAGDEYFDRNIIIPSVTEQSTVFLLNATDPDLDVVEPRFTLQDPSNQFDAEQSELIFERPIKIDGKTRFVAVAGDRIGLNGYDTILEEGQRYRVTVRDPQSNSERSLGEFTATASEPIRLTVQDVVFDSEASVQGLEWTARYLDPESGGDEVEFIFRDAFETVSLEYQIHERGNESNVLVSDTTQGNATVRAPVPPSEEETVWVVEFTTRRTTGETLSGERVVSAGQLPVGPGLAPEWQTAASMIGLFVIAGLFGAASPGVGGIAVASAGGVFFLLGWLPDSTGGLMVILALFVAVLSYAARQARGATA